MFSVGNWVTSLSYHNRFPCVVSLGFVLAAAVKFCARTVIIPGSIEFILLQYALSDGSHHTDIVRHNTDKIFAASSHSLSFRYSYRSREGRGG